jgi:protein gp37
MMPSKTKIEWADYVSNPVRARVLPPTGSPQIAAEERGDLGGGAGRNGYACVKISEGCAHCWASAMNVRLGTGLAYTLPNLQKVGTFVSEKELQAIRTFKPKGPFKNGRERALIFPCDMTDLFGAWMNDWDIGAVFNTLASRKDVDFLILTKRPEIALMWLDAWMNINSNAPQNVWIGCSVENEKRALERISPMRIISKMGFKTVVSYEPALESVDWSWWTFLDWLICGGESGNQARPMSPNLARSARDFCVKNEIPFFFKQWGEWAPVIDLLKHGWSTFKNKPMEMNGEMMAKVGKGMAGHLLDGVEWHQAPGAAEAEREMLDWAIGDEPWSAK